MRRASTPILAVLLGVFLWSASPALGASAGVYCFDGDATVLRSKPRQCTFVVRGADPASTAGTMYVDKLRWTGWGTKTATGKGVFRGNMDYSARVTVTLRKLDRCQVGGRRFYSEAVYKFKGQKATVTNLTRCDG